MPNIDTGFGTKAEFTKTLASLADGASWATAAVNFTTGDAIDVFIFVQTTGQASGTDFVFVYAYASMDNTDAEYTDGATGSSASFTTANILNSPLVGTVAMNATTAVKAGPWSLASAMGGLIPARAGLIVNNESAAALSATEGDHVLEYMPVYVLSA